MAATARFDLKLDPKEKELFSKAADLMGTSTASFVRTAAIEKARTLLEQETRVVMSAKDFARFAAAINKPFAPNEALIDALQQVRRSVRRA